ncbi:MAG: sensor histidine kinase [Oscillospiraceae bacterium]
MSVPLPVAFQGEYKIADGEWRTITEGEHISALKGDVTLRGRFKLMMPDRSEIIGDLPNGTPIALYHDHIGAEIYVPGQQPHICDIENPMFDDSVCGKIWGEYCYTGTETDTVEIVLKNNHNFGNENAVDDFLNSMYVYAGEGGSAFKESIKYEGNFRRILGIAVMVISLVILGISLFSSMMRIPKNEIMWTIGFMMFFGGGYFVLESPHISLWNNHYMFNTISSELCMMLYMLSMTAFIAECLDKKVKRIGYVLTGASWTILAVIIGLSFFGGIRIYDTNFAWSLSQALITLILLGCVIYSLFHTEKYRRILLILSVLLVAAFHVDFAATAFGWWQGGFVSNFVFILMFFITIFITLLVIPKNIRAAMREKELKAELEYNQVAIMISQIQPHFIYNTLGTIEHFCTEEPQTAARLVRDFSLYLRGNFSELDSFAPISLSKELEHVKHYVNIEKVRFPDMTVKFDIKSDDFLLPALSVQPLVENAIKHGLMGLESGGTVIISAYETKTDYCICVEDDGVGFDSAARSDDKKHVGIRNIKIRLELMCGGSLDVQSVLGKGTKALITIPKKEEKEE